MSCWPRSFGERVERELLLADAVAFAALPDVVRREAPEISSDAVEGALRESIEAALDQLTEMRRTEGEALAKDLAERVERIGGARLGQDDLDVLAQIARPWPGDRS